jgi:hypothetical protein
MLLVCDAVWMPAATSPTLWRERMCEQEQIMVTRRERNTRFSRRWLIVLAAILVQTASFAQAGQWQWKGVDQVVAVGDIHGAYQEFVTILTKAGLVDADLHWSGGQTHLVSVGDIVDRGAHSREILDLIMQLQEEAAAAGGQVHVTLANHEAMRLGGEFEYVSKEEYAAFADEELADQRAAGYQRYLAHNGLADEPATQASFAESYPPGYFGLQAAFSPQGHYGSWILERPVVIVINETAYVHGGVSDSLAGTPPEQLNQQLQSDLRAYAEAWQTLLSAGVLSEDMAFDGRAQKALAAISDTDPALRGVAEQLAAVEGSQVFSADGPLWNRGTAWCNPNAEVTRVDRALKNLGAARVALGHTPTVDFSIINRMDGRVVMIDTGMLKSIYHGRPSALLEDSGTQSVLYADTGERSAVTPEIRRVGTRPDRLTDEEIEKILSEGKVVSIEDVGQGVTKPQKVTVKQGDVEISGLFKTESTDIKGRGRTDQRRLMAIADRWQYEVAAYRIDKMIGLNLVPVTVERTINGKQGSLQFWINGLVSELDRETKSLSASGWCPLSEQWPLMFIFDALIYNDDRTKQNMTYGGEDWMMFLIDNSRAFRTDRGRPKDIRKVELQLSSMLSDHLESLNAENLGASVGRLLERSQIQALLRRRDEIVEDGRKSR